MSRDPYLFLPGVVVLTGSVNEDLRNGLLLDPYIERHLCGDWGEVSPDDAELNTKAVGEGLLVTDRVMSVYTTQHFGVLWIITEPNHGGVLRTPVVTTVLHPNEY